MEKKNEKVLEARKAICPIIFVKDAPRKSEDVNNLFFVPYDIACVSNGLSIVQAEEASKNIPEDTFNKFSNSLSNIITDIECDAIRQYLKMNIFDVINSFFTGFISKNIISLEPIDPDDSKAAKFIYPNFYLDSINLDEFIDNIPFTKYYKLSSIYYSQVVTYIFMKIVEVYSNIIATEVNSTFRLTYNNFAYSKKIFKTICKKVYGDKDAIDPNYVTKDYMYTFISSVIREDFERESFKLYQSLLMIAENAAKMADKSIINPVSVNTCIDDIMSTNQATPKQIDKKDMIPLSEQLAQLFTRKPMEE